MTRSHPFTSQGWREAPQFKQGACSVLTFATDEDVRGIFSSLSQNNIVRNGLCVWEELCQKGLKIAQGHAAVSKSHRAQ